MIGLGLMSGTSTDGLDLALIEFEGLDHEIRHKLLSTKFIGYEPAFRERLAKADQLSGRDLRILDVEFAHFIADASLTLIAETAIRPDYIASHGHTVFHVPSEGYTLQIGCGATIAALTGIPCVSDFRQGDIGLGGQGAPLVPIGDELLFNSYDYCINLGGFANISFIEKGTRVAFDICPLNVVMNPLAEKLGHAFDPEGEIASAGQIVPDLLHALDALSFYDETAPKSLGMEWVNTHITPLIATYAENESIKNLLRTFSEHAAKQIAKYLSKNPSTSLFTGGGTKNKFLMKRVQELCPSTIERQSDILIDFKEAIIFALLGYLRINNKASTLTKVTGARKQISAGAVYLS